MSNKARTIADHNKYLKAKRRYCTVYAVKAKSKLMQGKCWIIRHNFHD
jgi:hypothetical protein